MNSPVIKPMVTFPSARRAGKSTFAEAMKDFLNTPGYNSAEASAAGGHDAYMRIKRGGARHTTQEEHMSDHKQGGPELVTALEKDAVSRYEEAFAESPRAFELPEPMKLTVRNGSEYKIKPFIGGEEFTPVRGYIGKRGKALIVFKPVGVADFEEMEMAESDAKATFGGFNRYLTDTLGEVFERIEAAREEAKAQERAEEIKSKAETYAEQGFGSW
ncbi:hypothetical protein N5B55_04765 [Ralstonia pickettii]|uniref:hypothetical protein n=1 Tax=Ralstonia pickettii TaxID=329 RepID=UPI0027149E63|nr:hypothetical protein [Ralstonia pickettii]WKZ86265.1 hypothetical protein N5B55_04765 [Ralstonia pickettii]